MANYPVPPTDFRNNADYHGKMIDWIFQMMSYGFTMDQIWQVAQVNQETAFRKGGPIWNQVIYNAKVFPGADLHYEYDLQGPNGMKKLREYTNQQGETKGPGEWEPISASEQA